MKEIKDKEQLNQYLHAFTLDTIFHEHLRPHLSLYCFEQGELICSQGDPSQFLYVLVKGKLKIFTTSAAGRTLILSFKKPLEIIGDVEYVRGIDIINTVEAITDVWMIGIHYRWLRKHGQNHAPLLQFLLDVITEKFHLKSNSMSFNLMYPVEVRLASYLMSVSFDETNSRFHGRLSTSSIKDAANLIGTSYRHLNRVIGQLCDEGVVKRSKGFIEVTDKERLRELANDNIYE